MVERLFFDGVEMLGDEFSVSMGVENAAFVFPYMTDSKFSIGDQAEVAAKVARDPVAIQFLIEKGFS
jgi:hypothetical protein